MVALKVPDRLSILTYVSQYYNYFHGRSPIGGMSGVKRPSSHPVEEPKEKKSVSEPAGPAPTKPPRLHLLPEPKGNLAPQERNLVKENPPVTGRRILVETSNTRSSDCAACGNHVHLVQRHLVDGKLYHRNCFRCKQCSNTLTSGAYRVGTEPGTLICTRHEEPNHLRVPPSSKAVSGENQPTGTTSASGIHLTGLESKKPNQEPEKTNQVLRNSGFAKPWEPSYLGTNKSGSVSISPISRRTDPVAAKMDSSQASITTAPSHSISSPAKTQPWEPSYLGTNKSGSVSTSPISRRTNPVGGKTDHPGASVMPASSHQTTSSTKSQPWEPSYLGTNKSGCVSTSPISCRTDPIGGKTDRPEVVTTPAPSHWTASSAKTQQARESFFQSGSGSSGVSGSSGLSVNKVEPVKNHTSPFKGLEIPGKTLFSGASTSGINPGSSEKDRARSILMHALPGPSTTGHRGSPGALTGSTGSSGSSPATSGFRSLEPKDIPDISKSPGGPGSSGKPGQPPPRSTAPNSPKGPHYTAGTANGNPAKDQPISRPAEAGLTANRKVSKVSGPGVVEQKSENPANWRSRLKPVGTKFPHQRDARDTPKPTEAHRPVIDAASAPKDGKLASPKVPLVVQDPAPSADQPQKKRLLVCDLEISSSWQKPRQQWEDAPDLRKVEEPNWPKKSTASVRPLAPEPFRKLPSGPAVSPSKLSSDYIPEVEIQKEVQRIERDLDDLELKGVEMEKQLRECEGDDREDALMVEWFKLIHEKQLLLRRESELMYRSRQQKLEEKQGNIETELRNLMNKPESLKTPKDKTREEELLKSYLATIDDRNEIVENLDEDRIRELEEDKEMAALIRKLGVPRSNQEGEKKKVKFGLFRLLQPKIKS
ncbi:MICAL-like protein 2 isoform X2 [Paroedura picta]